MDTPINIYIYMICMEYHWSTHISTHRSTSQDSNKNDSKRFNLSISVATKSC